MIIYCSRYIYEGFLIWIIYSTYRSHIVIILIILSRAMSHMYDLPSARVSSMIAKFESVVSLGEFGLCALSQGLHET